MSEERLEHSLSLLAQSLDYQLSVFSEVTLMTRLQIAEMVAKLIDDTTDMIPASQYSDDDNNIAARVDDMHLS